MKTAEFKTLMKSGDFLARYLNDTRGLHIIPGRDTQISCPNGAAHAHGDANKSARYYSENGSEHIHCHGCGGRWDLFDLVQFDEGGDFMAAANSLSRRFGIDLDRVEKVQHSPSAPVVSGDVAEYLKRCAADYGKSGYLRGRGISDGTAKRFGIGYDDAKKVVVFPCGAGYALRVAADGDHDRRYLFAKGVKTAPFNAEALWNERGAAVFVVEGQIDALSIIEAGGEAVGLGGISHGKALLDAIRSRHERVSVPVVVAFDNDDDAKTAETVRKSAERLRADLRAIGVFVADGHPVAPEFKDPNEELQQNPLQLREDVARISRSAIEAMRAAESAAANPKSVFGSEVDGILLRRFSDIPETIPEDEDENALIKNFALAKGEGWIVGGEPGVGKSTFIQQFAMFAAAGKSFFGYEFTRPLLVFYLQTELQARKLKQADDSFVSGFKRFFGWTDDEIRMANNGVVFDDRMIGNVCDDLESYLLRVFEIYRFDLLIIDPLLTFADGDLSLQKDAKNFFYVSVNRICGGRHYSCKDGTSVKFGVIVLAHMGKAQKDKNGNIVNRGQYATAGSYVLNAWARHQINLVRSKGDIYALEAVKNPECSSWRGTDGSYTDTIYLKRAGRGERYWTRATADEIAAAGGSFNKSAAADMDLLSKCKDFAEKIRSLEVPLSEARATARANYGRTVGEDVYTEISSRCRMYGLKIIQDGRRRLLVRDDRNKSDGTSAQDLPGMAQHSTVAQQVDSSEEFDLCGPSDDVAI